MAAAEWRPLQTAAGSDWSEPLVTKYEFLPHGYSIWISDLSKLWCESLSKTDIIERAKSVESSIDPSQDDSQYNILLTKLKDAFDNANRTGLYLRSDDTSLRLELSVPLHELLPPLRWRFQLSSMGGESLKDQLVMPLIGLTFVQTRQIDELFGYLSEKDNLISRILDKVESLGFDLTSVLPHVGSGKFGKKGSQREHLAHQVRGLAAFKAEEFISSSAGKHISALESSDGILKKALQGTAAPAVKSVLQLLSIDITGHDSMKDTTWNEASESRFGGSTGGGDKLAVSQCQSQEFQRQSTPPKHDEGHGAAAVKSSAASVTKHSLPTEDDETTDEEGGNTGTELLPRAQVPTFKQEDSDEEAKPSGARPKRLGKIGGKATKVSWTTPAPSAKSDSQSIHQEQHSNMDGQSTPDERAGSSNASTAPISSSVKSGKRMGKVSGTRTEAEPSESEHVGQRNTTDAPTRTDGPEPEGVPPAEVMQGNQRQVEAESAEERADRKREELKRQLEEKSKAQGRKKRKF